MISDERIEPFKPLQGLLLYKRNHDDFYLQTHDILEQDGKFQWGEGKPFHREQLQELAAALQSNNINGVTLRGMLPKNVLYYQPSLSGTKCIWYLPAGKRFMNFHEKLKIKSGEYRQPGLIMAFSDKTLYVFAFKGAGKPTEKTKLFKGPFFNVYDSGTVCMGTTSEATKKVFLDEEINRWERRFFGSRFTHTSDEEVLAKGHNIIKLYKTLGKKRTFPVACLNPAKYNTLGSFINYFVKGGKHEH